MRAIQLVRHGRPGTLELREVPAPQPGADEVVVRVEACGLNHLDLWLEEAGLPLNIGLPRTPGCEPAGVIAAVGSGVTACHHLLAMERAGLKGARLYTGSWSGWIQDPSRPVAKGS